MSQKRRPTPRSKWGELLEARNLLTQLADLNGDGQLDAYYMGAWYENTSGKGDFRRHELVANAGLMAHADIDADGDPDLVTAPLAWYENNGQGQFTAHTMSSIDFQDITRFKFTDVGHDGQLDLVVFSESELALLRNIDGRGTFSLELRTSASNVADAGDIDGDGDLDLLILDYKTAFGRVSVDRNVEGRFNREFLFENRDAVDAFDDNLWTLAVYWEDIDGDGQLDFVRHGMILGAFLHYRQELKWLPMSQADKALDEGTLIQPACAYGMDGTYGRFHLSDLDADGDIDSWCFGYGQNLGDWGSTGLNDGQGRFKEASKVSDESFMGFELTFTDAGDLNRDGVIDFISNDFSLGQPTWVDGSVSSRHDPTKSRLFEPIPITFGASRSYTDIKLADLDGDGKVEALLSYGRNLEVWQSEGNGTATWSLKQTVSTPAQIRRIAMANMDGSPGDEVLLVTFNGVRLLISDGVGHLTLSESLVGARTTNDVAIGDLDEDGDLDLVIAFPAMPLGQQALQSWLNDGRGGFTLGQAFAQNGASHVRLGDFDEDGDLDAMDVSGNSKRIWSNDGRGAFTGPTVFGSALPTADVAVADLDQNGALDFYFLNVNSLTDETYLRQLPFSGPLLQTGQQEALAMALGDLDNDGDYDVVLATQQTEFSSVLLNGANGGAGQFVPTRDRLTNSRSVGVALGDVDGDGDLDVGFANDGSVEIFLNRTNPLTPRNDLLPPRPAPRFDDHGNTFAEATTLSEPTSSQSVQLQANREFAHDIDSFTFPVVPNITYRIRTNSEFTVRTEDGELVERNLGSDLFMARGTDGTAIKQFYLELSGQVGAYALSVEAVRSEVMGDANLDGVFDSADLVQIFQYGQFEDAVEKNSDWWTGDWNGDYEFTTSDLILAMQSGEFERPRE